MAIHLAAQMIQTLQSLAANLFLIEILQFRKFKCVWCESPQPYSQFCVVTRDCETCEAGPLYNLAFPNYKLVTAI